MFITQNREAHREPLQSPVRNKRRGVFSDGYSYEDQSVEKQKAVETHRSPGGNVVPDVEIKPGRPKKQPGEEPKSKRRAKSGEEGAKLDEQGAISGEEGTKSSEEGTKQRKKGAEAKDKKLLDFKKFDIPELDSIFTDFKTTFDPFVQNREDMTKAEDSFKKAVMSLEQISPHAQFSEYVGALKTRLSAEGIAVKVKEGALAVYTEGKKTVQGISDAVDAVNAMLKLSKDLKAMPLTIFRGSEDAVERADGMDVQGILKREFKSMWDFGKIPKLRKAFSNNVQQVKRAPEMVRDFYSKTKEIILEIYHAFADEEEQKKIKEELAEGDVALKDKEKRGDEEGATGENTSKKNDKKGKKKKEEEEFHKKLKFDSVGLDDIDNVFTSLATAINPFVETRERVQAAKESFENIVKSILNFDAKKELKDYIKELKKDAKEGNITIYIDEAGGEIKVKSVEGVKPPKPYRDAVQALKNIKTAGSEAVELEPHVQHGIGKCVDRITQINPQRDFHSLLKKKTDVFTLPGKIKKFNENRKKAQEIPGIVKEFCLYVGRLLTDILEALTGEEDEPVITKEEGSGEGGDKSPAGEDEPVKRNDENSGKELSSPGKNEPANTNDENSAKDGDKNSPDENEPANKNDENSGKDEEKSSTEKVSVEVKNEDGI